MAKIRVYELARELKMESKELVEALNAGGLDIKNYMSTLDEEMTSKARKVISGAISEVVIEKRVKPRVIRRRKKLVQVEEKDELTVEPVVSEEDSPAQEPEAQAETVEAPPPEVPEAQAPAEIVVPVQEPAVSDKKSHEPDKPAKTKGKKGKKRKSERPAKIISQPEEGLLKNILARETEKKHVKPKTSKPKRRPSGPVSETPKQPRQPKVFEPPPDDGKPSKKKKGWQKDPAGATPKRSVAKRRKKEVYERSDLYQDRGKKRKGKKGGKKTRDIPRKLKQTEITTPKAIKRRIKVQDTVTVTDLAKAMGTKATELLKLLMKLGVMANINQLLDFDTASLVADELNFELEPAAFKEERFFSDVEDLPEDLVSRPPVVTIMGHVDHGKTSLLDYIRESNIIGGESGGITQHIGAYYVKREAGDIVFLDTPGHEAFTAMRARGAKITDIIILVVAADDGAMPQTKEAINHGRAAGIPIIVAINKMDKANADPERVKRELAELDLAPEEWGGSTLLGEISAKTGEGVDDLLGLILLQSEMLELSGNPGREARGSVVEAELDKSRGPVATVLIQNGTLNPGDQFVCGEHFGRVRAMLDSRGRKMTTAGPSTPVVLYGISGVPMAGDEFIVVKDEKIAKQIIDHRKEKSRKPEGTKTGLVSLDDLYARIKDGGVKELNIILKADVQGSSEALSESLVKQSTDAVKLQVIHSATGGITESDVTLASASGAIILGFNVRANPRVMALAEKENIDIRFYDVIYNAINDVRLAMTGLLEPILKEKIIGRAEVREIFRVPKVGAIAGSHVTDGHVERNAKARLLRDEVVVFDGLISSLRRFKDDVKEVQSGYECGIGLDNFGDVKPGDVFEIYQIEEVAAEL